MFNRLRITDQFAVRSIRSIRGNRSGNHRDPFPPHPLPYLTEETSYARHP